MCQQQIQVISNVDNKTNTNNNKIKSTYTIKKLLKTLFKKQRQQQQKAQQTENISASLESFESLENMRNSQMEEQYYEEIEENSANEKLDNIEAEDIFVPVRFARTNAGTFFWTTNLQPVLNTVTLAADEDLLQPAYCYSNYQFPSLQYKPVQDRWAQA